MEIFKGAGVKHHDVEKFWKLVLVLFRPKVNFGAKQKVELQTFVLEGHLTDYTLAKWTPAVNWISYS